MGNAMRLKLTVLSKMCNIGIAMGLKLTFLSL